MTKVATCLWFNGEAEEAARLYTSLIPDSRIDRVNRSAADNPSTAKDEILTVDFTLGGHEMIALNGGPEFPFTEAASLSVLCEDQEEVDRLWTSLIIGGGEPSVYLPELMNGSDRAGAERAMQAMLRMTKLDVERLREAYEGVPA